MTSEEPSGPARWDGWLGPKQWGPLAGSFAVAAIVLAILLGLGVNDSGTTIVNKQCQVGEPGCELRQKIHEHADFLLIIRGQKFDFGQPQFISTADNEKSPNVHIHDPRHTVVHVHREQTTWDEFFRSLGFGLSDITTGAKPGTACLTMPGGQKLCESATETFKFWVNAVRVDGIADLDIHGLERVLVSFGSESEQQVHDNQLPQVTDEACIPSGLCESRGSGAGEHGEPEPCSKNDTQCN